ncbi:tetratricopeptide repeat protein [Microbaculum marinum]|uniref:Tetratricopeptide repeat protein n=1 Tax=Microbaculum marinum TaxID=1764581 RepID=A0AAW9RRU4_9HYPH
MPRSPHRRFVAVALAALISASAGAGGALAAGGNDTGTPVKSCPRGQVLDEKTGKCVSQSSDSLDDQSRYAYGAWLARSGRYGEAIEVLSLVEDKDDPRVLTYLGYAHRQLSRFEVGLGYYRQALAADPDHVQAREYLGEAYLILNKPDLAREQLREIELRCGSDCEEYRLLASAIADHEKALERRS